MYIILPLHRKKRNWTTYSGEIADGHLRHHRSRRRRRDSGEGGDGGGKEEGADGRLQLPRHEGGAEGCINDVMRMRRCLVERFGFSEEDITILIDTDDTFPMPTGANIRRAMADLVSSAEPGDCLFFHYSGHGTRLPAETGEDDDTGYDECIVPCDMNLITGRTSRRFQGVRRQVPRDCRITIVSDSCHSGGLIEESKEQIGESTAAGEESSGFGGNKSLPLSTLIDILKQKTGKEDLDVGQLRTALFDIFGEDSSPKVQKFMKVLFNKLTTGGDGDAAGGGGFMGMVGGLAQQFLKQKLDEKDESYLQPAAAAEFRALRRSTPERRSGAPGQRDSDQRLSDGPDLRGCELAGGSQRRKILAETEGQVSNRELVTKARELMVQQGFSQRPGLYCNDEHADAPFVC
ncbi:unnamed protein product [Spirodela intermedia]|uniref:Peptidase C14 caspase domain-containing protein n=1 Tax=Spirodela intermedia TaxID=51605 RepID=A0A7I8ILX2_SPIIN|nr:unnamed protein product [Spirodela intermedia]CAA6658152.1 unnamed protein product [Spirodela intermedia]